jgi:hypothetical protein
MARAVGRFRVAAWCALAAACSGCAVPNLYTTPRATQVSKFVGVLAPQLVAQPELRNQTYGLELGGRLGLAPRLDAGVRTNFAAAAADVKWNAIRSKHFDVALDGGVEVLPETFYVDMPLLFGVNLSDAVSLLPNTGITLGEGNQPTMDGSDTYDNGLRPRRPAGRILIRAGMGAQLRLTPRFAVVPEFTYLGPLDGGIHGTSEYFAFGIGFCLGPQPY